MNPGSRYVKFLIERVCPSSPTGPRSRKARNMPSLFPFEVSVAAGSDGLHKCGKPHYQVHPRSTQAVDSHFGFDRCTDVRYICEASGRFLEER